MKALSILFFILVPHFAMAEGRALTLSEYFDSTAQAGDVVCEVVQNTCYLTVGEQKLTEAHDPSGVLQKGTINPNQRQFTTVTIREIMGELDRGQIKTSAPIDVYVKVAWEARDNGPLAKHLGDTHIVHGRLTLTETGAFQFEVTNIPDMVLLGMYTPSLDIAEVFGRQLDSENEALETDVKLWLQAVLTAVVPKALSLTPSITKP